MGEKIKDLAELELFGENVKIELNAPYDKNYSMYDIHIQSKKIQFSMTDKDFLKLFSAIVSSSNKLKKIKRMPTNK